ncbi:acyltransferase [Escherichia coli]|nr:acyltransferase [Escherichia coli]HEI3568037.1 acyltransferase [Escherichia coli]
MIYSIGYIRGLSALFVMLFHYKDFLNDVYAQKNLGSILFGSGSVGVDLFFVISGFIIFYSTRKIEEKSVAKFIIRRVFRIYPLLILSILFFIWVSPNKFTVIEVIRALVPLNKDYHDSAPYFGYNAYPLAWTLTYEMLFYSIFMTAMAISHKYRALVSSIIIMAMVCGIQLYFSGSLSLNAHARVDGIPKLPGAGILQLLSSPMLFEFVYGMVLAFIYDAIKVRGNSVQVTTSKIYLWVCGCLFATLWFSYINEGAGPINYGVWALIIIPSALAYEKINGIKPNAKLLFFGDISYSLYLVHILVPFFLGYKASFDPFYIHLTGVAKLIYVGMISIVCAYVAHISIEKPMIKLSRKIINKL